MEDLFGEVSIFIYPQTAMEDGVLIDVSEMAREAE